MCCLKYIISPSKDLTLFSCYTLDFFNQTDFVYIIDHNILFTGVGGDFVVELQVLYAQEVVTLQVETDPGRN